MTLRNKWSITKSFLTCCHTRLWRSLKAYLNHIRIFWSLDDCLKHSRNLGMGACDVPLILSMSTYLLSVCILCYVLSFIDFSYIFCHFNQRLIQVLSTCQKDEEEQTCSSSKVAIQPYSLFTTIGLFYFIVEFLMSKNLDGLAKLMLTMKLV